MPYRRPPLISSPHRLSRRSLLGVAAGSLLLTGCVVEPPRRGPIVPTPTAAGGTVPAVPGSPGRWAGRELRVAAAGDDIASSLRSVLWEPFASATGCRLTVGYVDYGTLSEGAAPVDLALVDGPWAERLGGSGMVEALDAVGADGTVPNLLPATATAVPAYGNAVVSAYRVDAVDLESVPVDWAAWWQSRSLPSSRTLAKGPYGTFEFALLADGVAPGELYPLDVNRAIQSLRRISGSIVDRWWETSPQVIEWLSGGRAAFGSALAHAVVGGQRAGRPLQPIWNQGLLFADCWVVPRGAGNADVARDFIAFALTATSQAALATGAALGPVSSDALPLVDPLLRADLPTAPENLPRLVRADAQWWADNDTAASDAFDGWLLGNPRDRS